MQKDDIISQLIGLDGVTLINRSRESLYTTSQLPLAVVIRDAAGTSVYHISKEAAYYKAVRGPFGIREYTVPQLKALCESCGKDIGAEAMAGSSVLPAFIFNGQDFDYTELRARFPE